MSDYLDGLAVAAQEVRTATANLGPATGVEQLLGEHLLVAVLLSTGLRHDVAVQFADRWTTATRRFAVASAAAHAAASELLAALAEAREVMENIGPE